MPKASRETELTKTLALQLKRYGRDAFIQSLQDIFDRLSETHARSCLQGHGR